MVTQLTAATPADYSAQKLNDSHRENFRWMLRCMNLNAGGNVTAGPQSTLNMAPGTPAIIQRDEKGLEEEAKPFEPTAYGATLGLAY